MTELLIKLFPESSSVFPLVRRIVKARSRECFHSSLGFSVSTLREEFKKHIKPFVSDISKYSTHRHRMKSGAASEDSQWNCASNLRQKTDSNITSDDDDIINYVASENKLHCPS